MKYQPQQLEVLRDAFRKYYGVNSFPAGENATVYENIETDINAYAKKQAAICYDEKKCKCNDLKNCTRFYPDKKSERLFASRKQLSQLLYKKSDKDSFYPGFIKLCCLFAEIKELPNAESEINVDAGISPLLGKWKYTCTSFDKSYQHGGEFVIKTQNNGRLKLNGQRMWRGLRDAEEKSWNRTYYDETEYTQWRSVFIFEIDTENFAFEYEVPQKNGLLVGYCKCTFVNAEGEHSKVNGDFYELNSPITGQIVFEKI
jgi:hypothetical protein